VSRGPPLDDRDEEEQESEPESGRGGEWRAAFSIFTTAKPAAARRRLLCWKTTNEISTKTQLNRHGGTLSRKERYGPKVFRTKAVGKGGKKS